MSDIQVTLQTISKIVPCPNADNLEIAVILGTQTVVTKEKFKAGDLVVFFPPDICLPADVAKNLGVSNYLKGSGRVSTVAFAAQRATASSFQRHRVLASTTSARTCPLTTRP